MHGRYGIPHYVKKSSILDELTIVSSHKLHSVYEEPSTKVHELCKVSRLSQSFSQDVSSLIVKPPSITRL